MRPKSTAAVCALLLSGSLVAAGPAAPSDPMGTATARHQVLQRGCHAYPFSYRVSPPPTTTTWAAEVFLIGPHARKLGSKQFVSPADPATGKSTWRLCRAAVVPGRYTMRMKVTLIDNYDHHISWVKPTTFRLSRR
ncbi:MAG: hypothetical protein M3237_19695 [Actinomycetota bacterium]|nr:hypothetical protein [Actinomycetota bacterium]